MKRKTLLLLFLLVAIGLSISPAHRLAQPDGNTSEAILKLPGLTAQAATAQEEQEANFLEQEAGISAYIKIDQEIDIAQLRESFKVVEQLKDSYLTGQIQVPDLEENWHPRVFVTRDGYVVAYYPKSQPTSIMLAQWITRDETKLTGTTLESAIREVLRNAKDAPVSAATDINYYHFQHPSADRMMLIREDTGGEDSFQLTIPSGLQLLDATWAVKATDGHDWSGLRIEGEELVGGEGTWRRFGDLLSNVRSDAQQTVKVWRGRYTVVLLYKAP